MQIGNVTGVGTTDFQVVYANEENDNTTGSQCQKLIKFPKNIPLSEIVEEKHDDVQIQKNREESLGFEAKIKSHNMFLKYVKLSCELEINISGGLRQEMYEILDDFDALIENEAVGIRELYGLFEKPKDEMRLLLSFSLNRFKQQESFDQVRKILHEQNITETV